MKKTDHDLTYAQLSQDDIQSIKDLEKRLGDICLIAVQKMNAFYVLEAKIAPNQWITIDEAYPGIEHLKAYYKDEETAKLSKNALKSFLSNSKQYATRKKPIRIRQID